VSGGRDYTDDATLNGVLDRIHAKQPITLLIEGGCPVGDGGADERARKWAKRNEVNCLSVPAKVKKHRWPAAGPRRNDEMAGFGADLWVLFPGGRGTASAKETARLFGIKIHEVVRRQVSNMSDQNKPWVARAWAGSRLLIEDRFAEAWEAQAALTEYAQRGTGFTRIAIDHEPSPADQPAAMLHGCKHGYVGTCPLGCTAVDP
jgi:hypothetical protein